MDNFESKKISFDYDTYKRLKRAYNKAVKNKDDKFTFDENEYVTNYAKYLIEYLEMRFKGRD